MTGPTSVFLKTIATEQDRDSAASRRFGSPFYWLLWLMDGAIIDYEALWKLIIKTVPPK